MANVTTDPQNSFTPIYPAIVCDNGSYSLKAGFAGNNGPTTTIPTVVGIPRHEMIISGHKQNITYVGQYAINNHGFLDTSFPIHDGIITDWDAMEQIWYNMYYENLRATPENFNILHTEPVTNSMSCREKLIEIMFELFNAPNTALASKSVLSLYSNAKTTGLVVDSGCDSTQVIPILNGFQIPNTMQSIPVGGRHVTQYMMQLINDRGYSFTASKDLEKVIDLKEKLCYCALDFKNELATSSREMDQQYKLPDGILVRVNTEAFQSPEIIFDPSLFNIQSELGGIHNVVYEACNACNIEDRVIMYNNIELTGGNTLFPYLPERLKSMVTKLAFPITKIQVSARPERTFYTWIGGSVLASLSTFEEMWIHRHEYDERGPAMVRQKCFC